MPVKRIIYKKIVPGDLRKFSAQANDSGTGGGARDLRFSPSERFFPEFKKMFQKEKTNGSLQGVFYWEDCPPTEVTVHAPDASRPNECRIGTVHRCFPESQIPESADDCILLIIQDYEGKVHPCFTSQLSLRTEQWNTTVSKGILKGLEANRRADITPAGYLDFEDGEEYTNGDC